MFPKLSQKAWNEIQYRVKYECDYDDIDGVILDTMDSFYSLFDLEKYPITWDGMFEYCKTIKSNRVEIHHHHVTFIYYEGEEYCSELFNEQSNIKNMLDFMVIWFCSLEVNHIILIGEIHGWWEKGENIVV